MATDAERFRRDTFDSVADAYDQARPSYPERLVDDLVALGNICEGSEVLEIGPGTGQLSVRLVERGARLVAVERGPNLAEVARRKLSRFADAQVVTADFDRWEAPAAFDAVVAATSFHWLDPSTRVARCAAILRPGGSMAIVQTRWGVAQGHDPFFAASQTCYSKWDPNHDPTFRQKRPEDVAHPCVELTAPRFEDVVHRRYLCEREHSAATYCDLLRTFSDVLALDEERRVGFLDCMSSLIDRQFGGRIVRHDMYDLCVARRVR
jgi:trans-aconitate methyltransferase